MKVIHARKMTDKIEEAIANADLQNREIERIELSIAEFDRLMREIEGMKVIASSLGPMAPFSNEKGRRHCRYSGVRIQDYEGEK